MRVRKLLLELDNIGFNSLFLVEQIVDDSLAELEIRVDCELPFLLPLYCEL